MYLCVRYHLWPPDSCCSSQPSYSCATDEIVDVIKEYNDKIYDSYDYSFVSKENCIIEYEINKEVNVKKQYYKIK